MHAHSAVGHACTCACLYVCVHACMYVCANMYVKCVCVCVCVCAVCMYVRVYGQHAFGELVVETTIGARTSRELVVGTRVLGVSGETRLGNGGECLHSHTNPQTPTSTSSQHAGKYSNILSQTDGTYCISCYHALFCGTHQQYC
jgi:hypothetical protein